jgi:3-phenylpropionate/trans-cinnamate dioxygenase ferredoxin reductase component
VETDYLIIGGGLAGGYAAEAIRSIDRSGELTLVTDENHRPYDRVPLSKTYLKGVLKRDRLYIRRLEHYQQNNIQLLLGRHVKRIDLHHKRVFLDDGDEISYGRLLLATGGRPRRLSIEGSDLEGIFYLRTLDDSERIRIAMAYAGKVVVIGGGFIGCEVATVMREKGLEVTMVEVFPQLLGRVLDKESAGWITSYFREMGVAVKTGVSAVKILGEGGRG